MLEVLVQYLRNNSTLGAELDASQIMKLSSDLYFEQAVPQMSFNRLAGLYWLCQNLGPLYHPPLIQKTELRLI